MKRLVVDASVAVKWYLAEPYSAASRRLLSGTVTLIVPGLFFAEFGNALWKRWRRGELTVEDIDDTLDALDVVPFQVRPTGALLRSAVEIATRYRCTVYDSVYLALAVEENARMITADRRFLDATASAPLELHILWVEEVS